MVAILANSIENAGRLSDSLQLYWNSYGVCRSVSLFETEGEFWESMRKRKYECVILEGVQGLALLIPQIRGLKPDCKIAVVTGKRDQAADNEIALICRDLDVEMVVTRTAMERQLELISKQLHIV